MIENKVFPQQRFSPVMKPVGSSDITYRPKPIKRVPDSGKAGPNSPVGVAASHIDRNIPRPSSNGSNFQPTGAVFKAKARIMSTGSVQDLKTSLYDHMNTGNQRGESVSSARALHPMKLHKITMVTDSDQKIIMSSNTEMGFTNGQGMLIGKFPQKPPVRSQPTPPQQLNIQKTTPSILQQTLQVGTQNLRPVAATTTLQILGSPPQHHIITNQQLPQVVSRNSVIPTFTTMGKPIATPGFTSAQQQSAGAGNFSTSTATAQPAVQHQQQAQTILPHTSSAGLKNVGGTIFLQGIPATQYGMIITSQALASPTVSKPTVLAVSGTNGQFINTSLQNIVPSMVSQGQATPTQTMAPPTVLTNLIIKSGQTGQVLQPGLNSPSPGQAMNQSINSAVQPTHFQYILPSIRMQSPQPGAKIQNHVIQMALPGTQLPQGSIQLTFTGNQPGTPTGQSLAQIQQVQVSPQQVQSGKIQLASGFKVVPSPVKQQPSPAASPQLNAGQHTAIQVIGQNMLQPASISQGLVNRTTNQVQVL